MTTPVMPLVTDSTQLIDAARTKARPFPVTNAVLSKKKLRREPC